MDRNSLVENQPYREVRAVNNSAIGYFVLSPLEFKKYYDNQEESEGEWYNVGSAIHCMILQPDEFYDNYVVIDYTKPRNEQQQKFADMYNELIKYKGGDGLISLEDNEEMLLDAYKSAYSTNNKSEKKLLEEATSLHLQLTDYFEYLKIDLFNKTVLSSSAMETVRNCSQSLMNNPKSDNTVKACTTDDIKVFNELEIYFEYDSVRCKSKIDRLIVDKPKKMITIMDIKSTSKKVGEFYKSFKEYDYERQYAFYCLAVYEYLEKQMKLDELDTYDVNCICTAVSTKEPYESRIYNLPMERIYFGCSNVKRMLGELKWHFETDQWTYPKSYYEGDGYEMLDY